MLTSIRTKYDLPLWIAVLLIIGAGLLIYTQAIGFEFIYFDDDEYITRNNQVQKGLTADSFRWAFTTFTSKHWHPLTWLSHMLDVELFGLNPAGHHLVNLLIHLLNALLIFRFLACTTSDRVPALLVALLFTIHPLHVENVAWMADRKDLLCTLFWMVTLNIYAAYAEQPGLLRYAATLLAFCLAALAKSMAITLPIVLLLIDFWPLQRHKDHPSIMNISQRITNRSRVVWLFLEKIPFLIISIAIGLVALHAMQAQSAYTPRAISPETPLILGISSFLVYLVKLFYPVGLIIPYPIIVRIDYWIPILSGIVVLCISVGTVSQFRRLPFLLVGWNWYLVTLLPVAGFIGTLRITDRYGYITLIGIYLLLSWSVITACRKWSKLKRPFLFITIVLLGILTTLSYRQAAYWRNTLTLFQHTLDLNPTNSVAHSVMGIYLQEHGRLKEGLAHQMEALRIAPLKPEYHYNIGVVYLRTRDYARALPFFDRAIGLRPEYVAAMSNRGLCLLNLGKLQQAHQDFQRLLTIDPDHILTNNHLGRYYYMQGDLRKAQEQFRKVLKSHPKNGDALANLAGALEADRNYDEAEFYFREAIQAAPDKPGYHFGLARLLTRQRRFQEAAEIRRKGLVRDPQNAGQHYFLAVDYYFAGDYLHAEKNLAMAKELNFEGVERLFERRLHRALSTVPRQSGDRD